MCRPVDVIKVPLEPPRPVPSFAPAPPDNVCPGIEVPIATALPTGELTSAADGDLRIYVTARPNPRAAAGATTVCHRDAFGRPVVAHINLHAPLITYLHATATGAGVAAADAERAVTLAARAIEHELLHVLAYTWSTIAQFRDPSRRLRSIVTTGRTFSGARARYLVTPSATYAIREHYAALPPALQDSSTLPGLEIGGIVDEPNANLVRSLTSVAQVVAMHHLQVTARACTICNGYRVW